jgi:diguanylate cyclase (GGDEF)-like protein
LRPLRKRREIGENCFVFRLLFRRRDDLAGRLEDAFRGLGIGVAAVVLLGILAAISGAAILAILDVAALAALCVLTAAAYVSLRDSTVRPVQKLVDTSRRTMAGDLAGQDGFDVRNQPLEVRQLAESLARLGAALHSERGRRVADRSEGERRATTFRQLLKVSQDTSRSLDLDEVFRQFAAGAKTLGGFESASVWTVDELHGKVTREFTTADTAGNGTPPTLPLNGSPIGRAATSSQPVPLRAEGERSAGLALPLGTGVGLSVVGVLEVRSPAAPSEDLIDALETLASHAATALTAARLHREVELRSETDPLTRVSNRRRLESDLKSEVARSLRYGHPLSLVMVDVDHFKAVNDDFGHQTGDEVLKKVAFALAEGRRETDSIYRFGGEEFALLLRETDTAGAVEVAERLRAAIPKVVAAVKIKREVTASLGVATVGGAVATAEKLVEAADKALYRAKESGRNRVISA